MRGRTIFIAAAVAAVVLVSAGGGSGSAAASTPTFSFRTAAFDMPLNANDTPVSIAIGDLDGQNGNDVVVVGYSGDLSVFLNDGHGGFLPGQHIAGSCVHGGPAGIAIGNFSSSGHPDLLVGCNDAVNDGFFRYQGNGDGTFQAPQQAAPIQAYAGENDQRQPVFVGNLIENLAHGQFGGEQSIVWNEVDCGNGCAYYICTLPDRFFATDFGSTECSIDVNDQGQVTGGVEFPTPFVLGTFAGASPSDWAFANAPSDLGLHTGSLIGAVKSQPTPPPDYVGGFFSDNFEPPDAQASNIRPLAAGDLNGDGTSEIVSGYGGTNQDQLALYQLAGGTDNGGTFLISDPQLYATNPAMNAWYGGAVADFNGDGHPDAAVLGSTTTSATTDFEIFPGDGLAALGAPQAFQVADWTTEAPMASGDLNGDGHPDLVTTIGANEGLPARLFVMYDTPTPRLTVSKNGSGSGSVASAPSGIDCGATCSAQFASGTQVTLTATPAAGSRFGGWSGGGCSGTGTCQVTLSSDQTVTANFVSTPTLTVQKGGTGSGGVSSSPAGISCGSACSADYDAGTLVTLTAATDAGSVFTGWSGGGCSGAGTCQVTLNAGTTVTANFALLLPPNTKITKATINSKKGHATIRFTAIGAATGFECALKKGSGAGRFKACTSPKRYSSLRAAHYTFEVRAVNGGLADPTPATKRFKITR